MKIYLLNVGELIRESDESRWRALLSKLDEARREKVLSAKTPEAKAAELGAGMLLQKAAQDWLDRKTNYGAVRGKKPDGVLCAVSGLFSGLSEPLALTYRYGKKGKPYFENIPLFFNISHSGEYVLCAVSSQEMGADIQKIRPTNVLKLAKRFFSEPECLAMECCESDRERQRFFFGLWSRKEAYGKLTGEGIAAVLGKDMQNADVKRDVEWLDVAPPEGYVLAVCRIR